MAQKTVEGGPDYFSVAKHPSVEERFDRLCEIVNDYCKVDDSEVMSGKVLAKYFAIMEFTTGCVLYDIGDEADKVTI